MTRKTALFLCLLISGLAFAPDVQGLDLASVKVGVGYIPDGSIFGGMVKASLGPFSTYTEFFKKSGTTTVNLGGNIFSLKLPLPKLHPYIEAGGGINRSSGGGSSKTRAMANVVVGGEMEMGGNTRLFAQVKYIYTFGSKVVTIDFNREVAIQAGLSFHLGL